MNSTTYRTLYLQALRGLMSGCVMPWEEDILSSRPLPDEFIDPYISRETDPRESMKLAYTAMAVWIEEAKKANYFTKRFVQLSKMIMNGVTLMGRGLVSLHAREEDFGDVPMSVQDLIGVASYHIRKSYLGVLQTAKSHPEVSERLLVNQLGWHNTLLRLYKTREKLNEKPASKPAALPGAGTVDQGGIPAAESKPAAAALPAAKLRPMENLAEFFAPGALGAPRAYRPLEGTQQAAAGGKASAPAKATAEETGNKKNQAGIKAQANETKEKVTEPGTGKNESKSDKFPASAPDPEKEKEFPNESEADKTEARTDDQNENEITANVPDPKNEESGRDLPGNGEKLFILKRSGRGRDPGSSTVPDEKKDLFENKIDRNPAEPPPCPSEPEGIEDISDNTGPPDPERTADPGARDRNIGDSSDAPIPPHPAYFRILYEASCRSRREGGKEGTMRFTPDEIRQLLSDPVFCTLESRMVPVLRQILESQ